MLKSLVYHFYTFEGFQDNIANKAHFFLMEKYFHVFDKIIFYIALDDIDDLDLLHKTQVELASHIKNKEIIFKTIKKTPLCESDTFKLGIIDNENNLDGSVFFAHNKGIFNVLYSENIPNILNWIHCLYFYSLNKIDLQQMNDFFYVDYQSSNSCDLKFYGPCLTVGCENTTEYADVFFLPKNRCMYAGTYYWININKYIHNIKHGFLEKPIITDRSTAEKFPGEYGNLFCNLMSRNKKTIDFTFDFNPYNNEWNKFIENFGDFENYTKEHFEMLVYINKFQNNNVLDLCEKCEFKHTIPTTLIFHLYVFDSCFNSLIYKTHKFLLNKYSNAFDKAIISICVDDMTNTELIKQARVEMSEVLHCKHIQFKTIKNTAFGEVQTFKNEIIDNINNIEGSVFFAHGKGITNANTESPNIEQILNWIHALYFYSFNQIENIEAFFYKRYPPINSDFITFYGPCLRYHYNTNIQPWNNKSTYMGSFYWFNGSALKRLVEDEKFKFPEVDNRYYSEMFPTLFGDYPENLISYNMVMLSYDFFNPYWGDWTQYINWFGDVDKYNNEHDDLLKNINFNQNQNVDIFVCSQKKNIFLPEDKTYKLLTTGKNNSQKKYTILTYNIGGYEVLHEVENKSDICEYVYITDDTSITSNTWNVVYINKDDITSPIRKSYEIRYLELWDYVHTDVVIRIDGSVRIVGDTDTLYNNFINNDADIGLMFHPWRNLIIDEYKRWCEIRNYDFKQAFKCLRFISNELDWDVFNDKGLFQLNIVIEKRNEEIQKLNKCVFEYMSILSKDNNDFERLDQTIYSVLYQKKFSYIKPHMMDYNILKGQPFLWCWHGKETPMQIDDTLDKWYLNNKEYKL